MLLSIDRAHTVAVGERLTVELRDGVLIAMRAECPIGTIDTVPPSLQEAIEQSGRIAVAEVVSVNLFGSGADIVLCDR